MARSCTAGFLLGELFLTYIVTLIVHTITGILATILLLRFWMQAVRVRPPNSIAPFMYKLTDWLVKPLRRILPGVGGYDWATLLGAFLIALLVQAIDLFLLRGEISVQALLVLSVHRLIHWLLWMFLGLIIIEVIFSWVNPHAPLAPLVRALTEPLMRPLRRVIPPIGGIDLSPIAAILLLQIAMYLSSALLLPLA